VLLKIVSKHVNITTFIGVTDANREILSLFA